MTTTYTVLLEDGTVGTVSSDTLGGQSAADFIGETVNVHLHDENGNQVEKSGKLVEVLNQIDKLNKHKLRRAKNDHPH